MPTSISEEGLYSSLLIQMLSHRHAHRRNVLAEICENFNQVKLTYKIKYPNRHIGFIHSCLLPDNYVRMEARGGIEYVQSTGYSSEP